LRKKIETKKRILTEKNNKIVKKIIRADERYHKGIEIAQHSEENRRIRDKIVGVLQKMEEKKSWAPSTVNTPSARKTIDFKHFTSKLLKPIKDKVEARKLQENKNFLMTLVRTKSAPRIINPEESKRSYHPPSKILVKPMTTQNKDFMGLDSNSLQPKLALRRNESVKDFKVSMHSPPTMRISSNFKRYYSGGPSNEEDVIFQGHYTLADPSKYHVTDFQKRVIIKIQALWRGFYQRKLYKSMKQDAAQRVRMIERMRFLKSHSRSKFFKAVLATSQKFDLQLTSEVFDGPSSKSTRSRFDLGRAQSARSRPNPIANGIHQQDFAQFSSKVTTPRVKLNVPITPNNKGDGHSHNTAATLSNVGSLWNLDNTASVENLNMKSERVNRDAQRIARPRPATAAPKKVAVFKPTVPRKKDQSPRAASPRKLDDLDAIEEMNRAKRSQPGTPKTPRSGFLLKHMKLFTAAKTNKYEIILKSGFYYYDADVNIKDNEGNSPLFYAARHGNLDICKFLTDHFARVNEPCSEGNTPLHMAFASGNAMIVIMLITKGGNLNLLNRHGQTPVAFGSESLLILLNLKSALATYQGSTSRRLPGEFDNNAFLQADLNKNQLADASLNINYKNLQSFSLATNPKGVQINTPRKPQEIPI